MLFDSVCKLMFLVVVIRCSLVFCMNSCKFLCMLVKKLLFVLRVMWWLVVIVVFVVLVRCIFCLLVVVMLVGLVSISSGVVSFGKVFFLFGFLLLCRVWFCVCMVVVICVCCVLVFCVDVCCVRCVSVCCFW